MLLHLSGICRALRRPANPNWGALAQITYGKERVCFNFREQPREEQLVLLLYLEHRGVELWVFFFFFFLFGIFETSVGGFGKFIMKSIQLSFMDGFT
ncbi:hypothetical protein CFP56_022124 [Quercus suber]|uniref:Uncharacterized protein n=1 Tax=Quercus suber TaxID=58331 RepID=A0AAW0LZ50_QUESU